MTVPTCWSILNIEPTNDMAAIRAAYAGLVKAAQANADSFQKLRQAYEEAMRRAQGQSPRPLNLDPIRDSFQPKLDMRPNLIAPWITGLRSAIETHDANILTSLFNDTHFNNLSLLESNRLEVETLRFLRTIPRINLTLLEALRAHFGWGDLTSPIRQLAAEPYDVFLKRLDAARMHQDLVNLAAKGTGLGYNYASRIRAEAARLICRPGKPRFVFGSRALEGLCRYYMQQVDAYAPWYEQYLDPVRVEWVRNTFLRPRLQRELSILTFVSLGILLCFFVSLMHLGHPDHSRYGDTDDNGLLFVFGCLAIVYILPYRINRVRRAIRLHAGKPQIVKRLDPLIIKQRKRLIGLAMITFSLVVLATLAGMQPRVMALIIHGLFHALSLSTIFLLAALAILTFFLSARVTKMVLRRLNFITKKSQ